MVVIINRSVLPYDILLVCMFLVFRINFTLKDLEVVSPAYDYFVTKLREITNGSDPAIKVEKLSTEFTQYFKYDRVRQLVRIRINLFISNDASTAVERFRIFEVLLESPTR